MRRDVGAKELLPSSTEFDWDSQVKVEHDAEGNALRSSSVAAPLQIWGTLAAAL